MSQYDNLSKEELLKIVKKQELDLKSKKYGLVWDDEKEPEQVVLDCRDNLPILKRIVDKEIKNPKKNGLEDNILIEGDNYHALSVLNYTHQEKVDIIYIDPPYNTGFKDFRYNDSYVEKDDGFRHSKWLNFMEKRLKLAKMLLKKEGVIYISIDDNEMTQLKLLCDSIFGYSNWIRTIPTIMNLKGNNDDFGFAGCHEYTLVYAKDKSRCNINHFEIDEDELSNWSVDDFGIYKKADTLKRTGQDAPRSRRPKGWFPVFISIKDEKVYVTDNDLPLNKEDIVLYPKNDSGEELSWSWSKKKIIQDNHNLIIT
jgi:adenine-specific DNA-methyltransferase